jgi:hypothetical protein
VDDARIDEWMTKLQAKQDKIVSMDPEKKVNDDKIQFDHRVDSDGSAIGSTTALPKSKNFYRLSLTDASQFLSPTTS